MSKTVQLTFNGVTAVIEPKQDGMYDLNDIWRVFKLHKTKQPSQWRTSDRRALDQTANLQVRSIGTGKGVNRIHMTLATIEALYAYAMWCDFEFYMTVIKTFSLVVEGKPEEAFKEASKTAQIRERERRHHPRFMKTITEGQDAGTLGLHPKHCHSTVLILACKKATGMTPKQFKILHGKSPRDALVAMDDFVGMERYAYICAKIEAYIEAGLSYGEIAKRIEDLPEE